jgi:hypothetical protein
VKGEYIVVLDSIRSDSRTTAHTCWQMGPMDGWVGDESALSWRSQNADANLQMQFVSFQDSPIAMECFEGSRDPLRGWVNHRGDDALPAPLVEFRYPVEGAAAVTAALLVPFAGSAAPRYSLRRKTVSGWAQLRHLEIAGPGDSTDHIGWSQGLSASVDDADPFVTDAPFVWLRSDPTGNAMECFLLDGSYLRHGGKRVHEGTRRETAWIALR